VSVLSISASGWPGTENNWPPYRAAFGIANLSDDRLQESAGEGVSANFVALLAQRFHYGNALLTHLNSEESVWSERESTALAVVAALLTLS
jgi:hypothetical protein